MAKWMDIREFQKSGLLQEVNRLFFHPRGLALTVRYNGGPNTPESEKINWTIGGIVDYRGDGEGVYFGELTEEDVARGRSLQSELEARSASREAALGFVIQPLEPYIHPSVTPRAPANACPSSPVPDHAQEAS